MKIAILTTGRFHVCDLARELDALGHEVHFYSCVPKFRSRQFGLPDRCNKTLFWVLAPLFWLMRATQNTVFEAKTQSLLVGALDTLAAIIIRPCDVLIGMSGMCTKTAVTARRKYGAQVWIERGSQHILAQKEILENLPVAPDKRKSMSSDAVRREMADYSLADTVVIPSHQAESSFLDRGCPKAKLFRNPYGVDLTMFRPTLKPDNDPKTVIFVGTWSLRKGCDILWEACFSADAWQLLHVGPIGDAPVPQSSRFVHHDAIPQWQLPGQFERADVFVLASREEGLSVVQAQALACGLPVVCTDRTGGEDLREELLDPNWIIVVPHDDVRALREGVERALVQTNTIGKMRDILREGREALSWQAYGLRYSAELERRCFARAIPSSGRDVAGSPHC